MIISRMVSEEISEQASPPNSRERVPFETKGDLFMIPQLRGLVVTTIQEGSQTSCYINTTFVIANCDAFTVDLAQAFDDLANLVRNEKIKERPVPSRREFIQPV